MGPELQALVEKFWRAESLLARARSQAGPSVWDLVMCRAVSGTSGAQDPYAPLEAGPRKDAAAAALQELMHDLEGWSMELQRHSPEDWNECMNVLVQCLSGSQHTEREPEFIV